MNKKGFVLIETIVVILVLCVLLIMLYGGYMNVITSVQKKSHYDNTEYIYKTTLVKDYLLEINTNTETETIITICQGKDQCLERFTDNYMKELINQMHINSIYITNWNPASIGKNNFSSLEATTQNYLNKLDATIEKGQTIYRLIVMYENENSLGKTPTIYEYASIKIGESKWKIKKEWLWLK